MSALRRAGFFLTTAGLLVVLLPLSANANVDPSANGKCTPFIKECGCGQILENNKCVTKGKEANMHNCTCKSDVKSAGGFCQAENDCKGTWFVDQNGKRQEIDPNASDANVQKQVSFLPNISESPQSGGETPSPQIPQGPTSENIGGEEFSGQTPQQTPPAPDTKIDPGSECCEDLEAKAKELEPGLEAIKEGASVKIEPSSPQAPASGEQPAPGTEGASGDTFGKSELPKLETTVKGLLESLEGPTGGRSLETLLEARQAAREDLRLAQEAAADQSLLKRVGNAVANVPGLESLESQESANLKAAQQHLDDINARIAEVRVDRMISDLQAEAARTGQLAQEVRAAADAADRMADIYSTPLKPLSPVSPEELTPRAASEIVSAKDLPVTEIVAKDIGVVAEVKDILYGDASTYCPLGPAACGPGYGESEGGRETATEEEYNLKEHQAALRLDRAIESGCGYGDGNTCYALVEAENGRKTIVEITDNGPLKKGRVIDLNKASWDYLSGGMSPNVLDNVKVTLLEGKDYVAGPVGGEGIAFLSKSDTLLAGDASTVLLPASSRSLPVRVASLDKTAVAGYLSSSVPPPIPLPIAKSSVISTPPPPTRISGSPSVATYVPTESTNIPRVLRSGGAPPTTDISGSPSVTTYVPTQSTKIPQVLQSGGSPRATALGSDANRIADLSFRPQQTPSILYAEYGRLSLSTSQAPPAPPPDFSQFALLPSGVDLTPVANVPSPGTSGDMLPIGGSPANTYADPSFGRGSGAITEVSQRAPGTRVQGGLSKANTSPPSGGAISQPQRFFRDIGQIAERARDTAYQQTSQLSQKLSEVAQQGLAKLGEPTEVAALPPSEKIEAKTLVEIPYVGDATTPCQAWGCENGQWSLSPAERNVVWEYLQGKGLVPLEPYVPDERTNLALMAGLRALEQGEEIGIDVSSSNLYAGAANYTGDSVEDFLNKAGAPSDPTSRGHLAVERGVVDKIEDYRGTAKQNLALLESLRTPPLPVQKSTLATQSVAGAAPVRDGSQPPVRTAAIDPASPASLPQENIPPLPEQKLVQSGQQSAPSEGVTRSLSRGLSPSDAGAAPAAPAVQSGTTGVTDPALPPAVKSPVDNRGTAPAAELGKTPTLPKPVPAIVPKPPTPPKTSAQQTAPRVDSGPTAKAAALAIVGQLKPNMSAQRFNSLKKQAVVAAQDLLTYYPADLYAQAASGVIARLSLKNVTPENISWLRSVIRDLGKK